MKKYVKATAENESPLLSIEEISSVIYVEDPDALEWYDTSSLMSGYVKAAKTAEPDYTKWSREQLLQLKEQDFNKFDRIRNDKVLFKILKYEDLTPNQLLYANGRKSVSRDVTTKEIKHILKLLRVCDDFYRVPSDKNKEFIAYLKKYGISLTQTDIKNIMSNLHIQDFSEGRYSNDGDYWGHALIVFEFRDPTFKFSCGKSLPESDLPMKIYIKINEDLSTKESVAVVSFHKPEYEMKHPIKYPIEKENPDDWE